MYTIRQLTALIGMLLASLPYMLHAQIDTAHAHLQQRSPADARPQAMSPNPLPGGGTSQPMSGGAPSIGYGSARTFGVGQQIDWSPTGSGGTPQFSLSVQQTLTGYNNPLNTVMKSDGSLYITNTQLHSVLRRTSPGVQTVFAGGNSTSWGYVNGTGTAARFRHPSFMAVDASGNIFVADQQNHRIRRITPSGVVSVFAGSGNIGSADGVGTSASFNYPMGLAFDGSGNLYVADAYNHRIRRITPSGVVSTYAGSGVQGLQDGPLSTARFRFPMALAFDANGDLYITDRSNHAVRKVSGGEVGTLAGNGTAGNVDGQGSAARFNHANNLVVEGGNVYMVDMLNHSLRHISPSGHVRTVSVAGQLTNPYGIARAPDGSYYITENTSNRIKRVTVQAAYSISPALPAGLAFDRATGRISGSVGTVRPSASYTVTARNASGTSSATVTFSVSNAPSPGFSPSGGHNFIVETVVRDSGITTVAALGSLPVQGANRSVQYFDGLGRPMQTIQWQGSPEGEDIVQHVEYDGFGRQTHRYLPYAEQTGNNGSFKANAKGQQAAFYGGSSWDPHVKKTPHPYAVTVFENSPLDRVQQQGAPGTAWQPVADRSAVTPASPSGHTVATEYGTNEGSGTEAVKLWEVTSNGAQSTANYAAGRLYRTVVKDENWTGGKTGTVEEYTDFEGHVVLRRIWESETKKLETYYVYDDFGDLRYAIPPAVTAGSFTEQAAAFTHYIYGYRYDERRRLKERKVPGKGREYMVYNKNDLPILTQDSVQRIAGKWSYTKYDAFGRVTETGIYTNTASNQRTYAQVRALADAVTPQWEERAGTANYTNRTFPTANRSPYVTNYYDDYTFAGATTTGLQPAGIADRRSDRTKTLLTGTRVARDDGTLPLLTIHYYDDRGRLIQTAAQNHLGGTDIVTNTYNFPGELLTSKREHKASATGETTTILTTNGYDHVGRLVETRKKVNSQAEVLQGRLEYNGIGQLMRKRLHSENGGTNFIDTVGYQYNERGWTLRMASSHFTQSLRYQDPSSGTAQYNGNIAQQNWRHGTGSVRNTVYAYDGLNRLKDGNSANGGMREQLAYDDMGNITNLKRDNHATGINYTYTGNRLTALSGQLSGSYTYDGNGNATKDRMNTDFTYNHLSLPRTAIRTGANAANVTYIYDALGTKLRKTATVSGTTTQREYIAGIEYSKVGSGASAIEMVHTEEGYLQRNTNNTYTYHYNLTDHLGNVRAVLQRTTATTGTVIQKQDYYPFGKTKAILTGGINKYLYNGKEVQGELGNQLDYGARFYDAEIGRWNVVDPLAEAYYSLTPYQYGGNTPVNTIDIAGKLFIFVNGFDRSEWLPTRLPGSVPNQYGVYSSNFRPYAVSSIDRSISQSDQLNYWGRDFVGAYNEAFGKGENNLFINASYTPRSSAKVRYNEGVTAGNNLLAQLESGDISLAEGETLKIVAHSQGAAYAAGMASVIAKHSIYGGLLEFVDYLSPHQPKDVNHPDGVKGRQFSTKTDLVSSKNNWFFGSSKYGKIEGTDWGMQRESYKGGNRGHSVSTWLNDMIDYWRSLGINVHVVE